MKLFQKSRIRDGVYQMGIFQFGLVNPDVGKILAESMPEVIDANGWIPLLILDFISASNINAVKFHPGAVLLSATAELCKGYGQQNFVHK